MLSLLYQIAATTIVFIAVNI